VHVDFDTQVRTPKASYYWLQEVLAARNSAVAALPDAGKQDAAYAGQQDGAGAGKQDAADAGERRPAV
jgi:beta-glucosidase